jgi:hypothetical protein
MKLSLPDISIRPCLLALASVLILPVNSGISCSARPHRWCGTAGFDLGERWPSRLVATAASIRLITSQGQHFRHRAPCSPAARLSLALPR